ncbi:MAG: hypothetical protein HYY57_03685, partial [Candidatus Omnitrophica bacterium]|nr:hypothetical protein [Candidatus Omnitrophota bacterium]
RFHSAEGFLLIGLILLLSAVMLAFGGLVPFLGEQLRTTSLRQNQTKALYLAQSGIMQAIYDFRFDGPGGIDDNDIRLGEYAVPSDLGAPGTADDDVFILGGEAADFLLAAMIPATFSTNSAGGACGGSQRHRLQNWALRNVLQTNTLPTGMLMRFSQVAVSWEPALPGEGLIRLDFNGTGADWISPGCAPVPSGSPPISIPAQTIPSSTIWGQNRMWFATTNMGSKDWIEIAFFMSDGSIRRARYVPDPRTASSASFTIKAVGEVRRGAFPFTTWRRLQAEYRLNDNDTNVNNLQEIGNITTDTALQLNPAAPAANQRPGLQELSQRQP